MYQTNLSLSSIRQVGLIGPQKKLVKFESRGVSLSDYKYRVGKYVPQSTPNISLKKEEEEEEEEKTKFVTTSSGLFLSRFFCNYYVSFLPAFVLGLLPLPCGKDGLKLLRALL